MNTWPVDSRSQPAADAVETSTKSDPVFVQNYPRVGQSPNVVTLVERDGRLHWTTLVGSRNQASTSRLRLGPCETLLPATRSQPKRQNRSTILQAVERGTSFLRTYHADVDIPSELIMNELLKDAQFSKKLEEFDPYLGNLLELFAPSGSAFLAYPTGELNCELSLSPIVGSEKGLILKPSKQPTRAFDTPIQQIKASPSLAFRIQSSCLAVRTFGCTSLFEVKSSEASSFYLSELTTIFHADTANRALVDISLSASPSETLIVTDHGSVYRCIISSGQKLFDVVREPFDVGINNEDNFWRLARGFQNTSCLLASNRALTHIDIRSNQALNLFTLPNQRDVLTSIEDQRLDNIVKCCSTREIIWTDLRFASKPLLGYNHGRQYDRYLKLHSSPLTYDISLLTTRRNGLITIYDVSISTEKMLHAVGPPYSFIPEEDASMSYFGQTLFLNNSDSNPSDFSLVRLTELGSLCQANFSVSDSHSSSILPASTTNELGREQIIGQTWHSGQEFDELDLSPVYNYIFSNSVENQSKIQEEGATILYDILERLPSFWHEAEIHGEQTLTTWLQSRFSIVPSLPLTLTSRYDIIFRAGEEPSQSSRSDFLTESSINTAGGYRAMTQGRLSPSTLAKDASWHVDIFPVLKQLDVSFPVNLHNGSDVFQQHDLLEEPKRAAQSFGLENQAREQLALDLTLSTDVFASHSSSHSSNDSRRLEAMTKTLSLDNGLPSMNFGYIHPRLAQQRDDDRGDETVLSAGVRSLLKDWEIGDDPDSYTFDEHYTPRIHKTKLEERLGRQAGSQSQSQHPPTIKVASDVYTRLTEPEGRLKGSQTQINSAIRRLAGLNFGSQVPESNLAQPSQEEYIVSTQILPGVHGGRPVLSKKKIKKHISGF